MKKFLLPLFLIGCVFNPAWAELKVVTVSMSKLFDGYYKTQEVQTSFTNLGQQFQAETEEMAKPIRALEEQLQALAGELENPLLSDDAKNAKMGQIRAIQERGQRQLQEFNDWRQRKNEEINRNFQAKRVELIAEIVEVVKTTALRQGAQLIFDTSDVVGTGVPTVLFADPSLDISDVVLRAINAKAPNK
jgi:outer membrane protein